jgi:glycosyltransferase involved in cell wall biosynthesis
MPAISVIIPTYNRKESLLRTLRALARQTLPADQFEVIVISDGSTDGTSEAVKAFSAPYSLRFIEQKNSGPSVARNHGARLAEGSLLVYVDDDIEPSDGFLSEHLRRHQEDPNNLVLIGPQTGPMHEPMPGWIAWEHQMLQKQYVNFITGKWDTGPNNLYSGNFSVSRENLLAVGGFEEKFTRQEDVELGFRLEKHGCHFKFCAEAEAIHRPTRTFASWYKTPYEYGRRDVQMARDLGEGHMITMARDNFKSRNRLTRTIASIAIGRPALESLVLKIGSAAAQSSSRKIALPACSLLFNLRYLQGMCSELGGRQKLWSTLQ